MLEGFADGRDGRRHISLGKPDQGQTGLWIPPGFLGREERRFCAVDVSFDQSDTPDLGQRPPELASEIRAQLIARGESFLLGLVPGSPKPEDLGAVDTTAPMQAPDGALAAPSLHGFGPLLGEIVLRSPLQRADELAVDDPGGQRIQLPGDRGDAGLVEQHQPLLDLARQDEASSLRDAPDGGCGRVEPGTDLDRPPGPPAGLLQVADQQSFVAANHGHPGMNGRLVVTVQQALGARQPSPDRRHERGVEQQVHGDPGRRARRRHDVAGAHVFAVGPLPDLDGHIQMARGVGHVSENGEVGWTQESTRVRIHQEVVGLVPGAPRRGGTGALQRCRIGHRNRESYRGNRCGHAYLV